MLNKLKIIYDYIPKRTLGFIRYLPNSFIFGLSYIKAIKNISYEPINLNNNIYRILCYARDNTNYGKDNIPSKFYIDEIYDVLDGIQPISSDDLNQDIEYFKSKQYGKLNSYITTTGGTGRKATTVILANECFGIEWAHMHKIWQEAGYNRKKHLKLTLRGKCIKGEELFKYNPMYNELVVDTFRLKRDNFSKFIKCLERWNINFIHGYPSLLREFMEYCKIFDYKINIKGIFLGSEEISLQDNKMLQEFFKCKVISWYGQTEKIILAADPVGDGEYKVFTSYGYPYIYNPDEYGHGEIIGTTFINKALPLINYRTGDYGKVKKNNENIILTDIMGRWGKDFVYLNEYKKIPTSSINIHGLIQREILFYQIYQKEYGKLLIKVLPKATTKLSNNELITLFKEIMANNLKEFSIKYEIVDNEGDIIKSKRGKMMMLVQEINNQKIQ